MRKVLVTALLGALTLAACSSGGKITAGLRAISGSNNDAFSSLVAKANAAKYKVSYKSGNATLFTIAQDPPRFSYLSGATSTYITANGSAVACSGTGPAATCTLLSGTTDAIKQGVTSAFGALGALLVSAAGKGILASVSKTSNRQIVGRDAVCATVDSNSLGAFAAAIGKGSYSVCVDQQTGVMLESKSDDGNGHVSDVVATAFGLPTNADLTPPATPVTIPTSSGATPST
jgi:hypothetical protein